MDYAEDRNLAKAKGIPFSVCTKSGRGKPWTDVRSGITDLREAMTLAAELDDHFEAGVFAHREGGGYLYWTSRTPDLLNSTVLAIDIDAGR